ncbi:unnamed protein product [Leptidea sinapis]|uniref:Uncharacterized protein n=1 Tax=Leptidea sinapis TaxID=189913 RepID=A0A5E4R0G7_9NEOP|nr:unnamed protein product [Leptidea sinapis]
MFLHSREINRMNLHIGLPIETPLTSTTRITSPCWARGQSAAAAGARPRERAPAGLPAPLSRSRWATDTRRCSTTPSRIADAAPHINDIVKC